MMQHAVAASTPTGLYTANIFALNMNSKWKQTTALFGPHY